MLVHERHALRAVAQHYPAYPARLLRMSRSKAQSYDVAIVAQKKEETTMGYHAKSLPLTPSLATVARGGL